MAEAAKAATAPKATTLAELDTPFTYYLTPQDEEFEAAAKWLELNGLEKVIDDKRVTPEIVISEDGMGMRQFQLVVLTRKPKQKRGGLSPSIPLVLDQITGERIPERRSAEDLATEVVPSAPIKFGDHWVAGEYAFTGKINKTTLINAINTAATPFVARFADLGSGARGQGEPPRRLVLRPV
jgi:hypothetical protein